MIALITLGKHVLKFDRKLMVYAGEKGFERREIKARGEVHVGCC